MRPSAKALAARYLPGLHGWYDSWRRQTLERRVMAILARPEPPDCTAPEAGFNGLQAEYTGVAEYGYDAFSTWKRGADRSTTLLALAERLKAPGARVLEAGCGDGMTGALLASFGHDVVLADADDWRDVRARSLPLIRGDLTSPGTIPEDRFDLIYSYNSFEHFADPTAVLSQLTRACRPGGLIYLEFGPLYCGPWGLHAYRTLRMPYPQFLFSAEFVDRKLAELGIEDLGRKRTTLQSVNRWRLSQFRALWDRSGCEVLRNDVAWADVRYLRVAERFPRAFCGRGLTLEDLVGQSATVLLQRHTMERALQCR